MELKRLAAKADGIAQLLLGSAGIVCRDGAHYEIECNDGVIEIDYYVKNWRRRREVAVWHNDPGNGRCCTNLTEWVRERLPGWDAIVDGYMYGKLDCREREEAGYMDFADVNLEL